MLNQLLYTLHFFILNGYKYHADNKNHKTGAKSYLGFVGAFWEFSAKDNLTYDYLDNGFDLFNKGAVLTDKSAYFPTNEYVRYRAQYQDDMGRIEYKGE